MSLAGLFSLEPQSSALTDWPGLVPAASRQFLLPALWQRVHTLGLTPTIPPDVLNLLDTAAGLNRERNTRILAEATHIAALLNTIGIQPVALKGLAYLLAGVYPDPATRFLQDIDFLIPRTQLSPAIDLLRQHGFIPDASDPLGPLRHHAPALQRPFAPSVELHHSLGLGVCARLLPAAEILRDATPISIDGALFLLPSPTHLASHLILHSQLSHPYPERIFPSLRALYDLQLLTQSQPIDWESIVARYRQHGHYVTLALHFLEAERVLALPPPFPIELTWTGKIRHRHRFLLARYPRLRFLDPIYLCLALFSRRLRLLLQIALHPRHWLSLIKALRNPHTYRNFFRL